MIFNMLARPSAGIGVVEVQKLKTQKKNKFLHLRSPQRVARACQKSQKTS